MLLFLIPWKRRRERERAVSPSAVFARNIQNLVLLVFKIVSVLIFNGKFPFDIHSLCWPRKNMDDTQSRGFISIKMEISLWYLVCCEKMFLGWKQDENQWHWRLGLLNLPLFSLMNPAGSRKGNNKRNSEKIREEKEGPKWLYNRMKAGLPEEKNTEWKQSKKNLMPSAIRENNYSPCVSRSLCYQ